ncbi:Excinuclease ABC subunit C [Seinonella peptonophila]|uniref:UvrABC system protein C n=1 Tax=Seinonella peptonophila TaxID=112248 RepID=A0A1M4U508_9BACL|nr:excinuclease ABC subunit UvrC [Seinonella peptonophila]SHE51724.1 Excinuclease ABC subunit C [Seinonella peptonophila]
MNKIKEKVLLLPHQPGCYLMKNSQGQIIYVGKAKNLRNRVGSYFTGQQDGKTMQLVMMIADFEYMVTASELEALILECNLIKKHRPKYNVLLKDDKSYPYIRLTKEEHPRLEVTRKQVDDGSRYFGPYPHAGAASQTKKLLDRLYPLRKCKNLPKRVCLYYHLGQCLAPCEYPVSSAEYERIVEEIVRFLSGDARQVKQDLKKQMEEAAEKLEFEKAKELRDLLRDIEMTMEKQHVVFQDQTDRDVFAFAFEQGQMCVQVLFVRQGKWMERDVAIFPYVGTPEEAFLSYLTQFYQRYLLFPKEVLLPTDVDVQLVSQLLPKVRVHIPQRGTKKRLLDTAMKNATIALQERLQWMAKDEAKTVLAAEQLGEYLNVGRVARIEAFDNSNLQGAAPVSAMICFIDGKPAKSEYRKYKIRSADSKDDLGMMKEVIRRRYIRLLREGKDLPDLILVDGGRGQILAAKDVLENELGLYLPIAGMVKDEKHQTSYLLHGDHFTRVEIPTNSAAFALIQRIQAEVHRFAITFHRQVRGKEMLTSALDTIPGVGAKRKQRLFQTFSSIEEMKTAPISEFRKAGIGEKLAQEIQTTLRQLQKDDAKKGTTSS